MRRPPPSQHCWLFFLAGCALLSGCTQESTDTNILGQPETTSKVPAAKATEIDLTDTPSETVNMSSHQGLVPATFGAGCYWCTEAVFQRVEGVENVVSGFMGGQTENPTYEDVCRGITGHAEVVQFIYDPNIISYEELLEVFWKTHDPTTLNRQGADEGTQYRSVVFYHTQQQRDLADRYKKKLDESQVFDNPIVTEITAAGKFFAAKTDHQNFYNSNPFHGYCGYIIRPKIEKLEAVFADKLKQSE